MKKLTQEQIIRRVIASDSRNLVPSWAIQKVNTDWGWLGTSADRTARKMAEQGKLHRTYKGREVYFSIPVKEDQIKLL